MHRTYFAPARPGKVKTMSVKTDVKLATLSYVIVYVTDTAKAVAYYRDTLGMKVKIEEDGWIEIDAGATTLALHHADKMSERKVEGNPILVFSVEKIKVAYEALKEKGIKFHHEPQQVCETPDHVGMSASFSDPWGNTLSIFAMEPRQ
jgi:predicted enzyme related to lactoylglutathione lyase